MSKSVLSIQSHVVHGYVGGKAAIFPLQSQGWEVDYINTVNFSNHTGYGSVKGSAIDPEELGPLLDHLSSHSAIITGYIPNAKLISQIHDYIIDVKTRSSTLYLLDPVMGDNNYLYVDEDCVTQNKAVLSKNVVDIITPNQFELELLLGYKITSTALLQEAIKTLHHNYNIKYVVVTSLAGELFGNSDVIGCAVSTLGSSMHYYQVPIIKSYFTGVGDLFAALLLDKLVSQVDVDAEDPLLTAVSQVLTIMSKTLRLTHRLALEEFRQTNSSNKSLEGTINDGDSMKYFELRIVQSREYFDYSGPGDFSPRLIKK